MLKHIENAFGQVDESDKAKKQRAYEDAIKQAEEYGAPEPLKTSAVQKAKAELDAIADRNTNEGEIYDHLYRFFERYYDNGDFISRRYHTRETENRAAPFAIPYDGEEVKLVWANMDQYYIKTTEYFNNYAFDLRIGVEKQSEDNKKKKNSGVLSLALDDTPTEPLPVHFKIIQATEGEHGNIKEADQTKRYFLIHGDKPVELNEAGELVINFEYRSDPEKTGQENTWKDRRNNEAEQVIFDALENLPEAKDYLNWLKYPAPTETKRDRTILAKYIYQYTAKNSMDYFIHKDLGTFLKRELDFYIKNEIIRLDDIENADAPAVESYLLKVRVLRQIARKIIDFLAQLEDFQKKLWLKKKFVVETNYCLTLDRVPEELYPQIIKNEKQIEEWKQLYSIQDIVKDTATPAPYSEPLTIKFLHANPYLMLDTCHFDEAFKEKLLASMENLDESTNGLMIHSENFQALNFLHNRYGKQVKCIHIDPPYNTSTSGFMYKNEYQHSSWLALMHDRAISCTQLLMTDGVFQCHIDENEYESLHKLLDYTGLIDRGTIVWDKKNPMLGRKGIATQHEYILWRSYTDIPVYMKNVNVIRIIKKAQLFIKQHDGVNNKSRSAFSKWILAQNDLTGGEKAYRLLNNDGRVFRGVAMGAPEPRTNPKYFIPLVHPDTDRECPVPNNGWSRAPETLHGLIKNGEILWGLDHTTQPQKKVFLTEESHRQLASVIEDAKSGKVALDPLGLFFPYCHPVSLYEIILGAVPVSTESVFLDYFSGSGTTVQALINLNRDDKANRKYILIEVADHFDQVMLPRIKKVVYSTNWKEGKPVTRDTGISHTFKYLRLESYEDTLNNLDLAEESPLKNNPDLKEDYILIYMLDTETKDSQSLLNIDGFSDPTAYKLKVKKPGTDQYFEKNVDLPETFNYLIGLRVEHIDAPQTFTARFKRDRDSDLPNEQHTKLLIDGRMAQDDKGKWWFRKVEGWVPRDRFNPNNGQKDRVLIVWRKLT